MRERVIMQKKAILRFLVLFVAVFTLLGFVGTSHVSAASAAIHGNNLFATHASSVSSFQFTVQETSAGTIHPDTGICTYIVYAPFIGTVSGQNYIIAQGGYTCNVTFSSASLVVTLNGPTTSSGVIFSHLFSCPTNQSSCAGWIGWPYQSGGVWQTVVNGGSASVGFTGQAYSAWTSL